MNLKKLKTIPHLFLFEVILDGNRFCKSFKLFSFEFLYLMRFIIQILCFSIFVLRNSYLANKYEHRHTHTQFNCVSGKLYVCIQKYKQRPTNKYLLEIRIICGTINTYKLIYIYRYMDIQLWTSNYVTHLIQNSS